MLDKTIFRRLQVEYGTQLEVAKALGITPQYLSRLLNGRQIPSDKLLRKATSLLPRPEAIAENFARIEVIQAIVNQAYAHGWRDGWNAKEFQKFPAPLINREEEE